MKKKAYLQFIKEGVKDNKHGKQVKESEFKSDFIDSLIVSQFLPTVNFHITTQIVVSSSQEVVSPALCFQRQLAFS